jgi:hypothetical protein
VVTQKCKQFSGVRIAENGIHSVVESSDCKIGCFAQALFVTAFDQNCATTSSARAIDIAPTIADDVTSLRFDVQLCGCAQNQAWPRLAATTRLTVTLSSVITDFNTIE